MHYIALPNGEKYPVIGLMRNIDYNFANIIAKQQVIQESKNKIVLKFVPGPDYRPFHDKKLLDQVRYHFLNTPELLIEIVMAPFLDNIRNGKHVIFESHIKD